MTLIPSDIRELYGSSYFTETPDGQIIPWKPLSIEEFVEYQTLLSSSLFSSYVLQIEIFRRCVTDKIIVDNIDIQKAGTIALVVEGILLVSGPNSQEELNNRIIESRKTINNLVHQIVSVICQAFPSYTPDVLYKMNYETLILRLALAEDKLLKAGLIEEPLSFFSKDKNTNKIKNKRLKNLKEDFEQKKDYRLNPNNPRAKVEIENIKPKFKDNFNEDGRLIITSQQMSEKTGAGIAFEDLPIEEDRMLKEANELFGYYKKQLETQGKMEILKEEDRIRITTQQIKEQKKEESEKQKIRQQDQNKTKKVVLPRSKKPRIR